LNADVRDGKLLDPARLVPPPLRKPKLFSETVDRHFDTATEDKAKLLGKKMLVIEEHRLCRRFARCSDIFTPIGKESVH
jgi:hypothetical protein